MFSFWMDYHNLTFPQSLRDLAERYNVPLPRQTNLPAERKKTELKEILSKINRLAGNYFHEILLNSAEGRPGRDYFSNRHITEETISIFELGYAPNRWDGLAKLLKSKGIPLKTAERAGLMVSRKDGDYYDRFRGRIIFPIFDLNQQIIGFGGRVLDDSLPKYINTPETPLYHKGSSLYGLDSAFRKIREEGLAILVEGYMDVLALRQHGMSNVVATLGTALTSDQTRKLKGYTKNVVVLFDPDEAGREAALKSFPLFLREGISAKVLVLPGGEDPDSFVNGHGLEAFQKLLEEAKPIFDFYLDQALVNVAAGVDGKIQILHEVLPIFMELEEGATRLLYVQSFAEKSNIDEAIIWKELKQWESNKSKRPNGIRLKERLSPAHDPRKHGSDMQFLNLMIHYPDTIREFRDQEWELIVFDPLVVRIVRVLMEKCDFEKDLDSIEEALDNPKEKELVRRTVLSGPFFSDESFGQAVKEFSKKIARIKISQSIKQASAKGDIEMLNRLIRAKQDLETVNTRN